MSMNITTYIQPKAFLQGLAVVFGVYVFVLLFIIANGAETLKLLEDKLPIEVIPLVTEGDVIVDEPIQSEAASVTHEPEAKSDTGSSPSHPPAVVQHASGESLSLAPIKGLEEPADEIDGKKMMIPKISPEGVTPFTAYKRPFAATDKPYIALVLKGIGLSENLTQEAINSLPADVSFVLSPYAQDVKKWQNLARSNGHETWMFVPSETEDYLTNDPGPQALLKDFGLKYNAQRLQWTLAQATGYAGVAMYLDKTFERVEPMIRPVLGQVFDRGLGLMQINASGSDFFAEMANSKKAPFVQNGFAGAENLFQNLENLAKSQGHAVAIVSLDDIGLAELNEWIASLEAKGIVMAPASATAILPAETSDEGKEAAVGADEHPTEHEQAPSTHYEGHAE